MSKAKSIKKPEMVTIVVTKPRNVVGDTETVVSINGNMYQIMYDTPVTVPKNVADVIMQSQNMQAKIAEEINKVTNSKEPIAEL